MKLSEDKGGIGLLDLQNLLYAERLNWYLRMLHDNFIWWEKTVFDAFVNMNFLFLIFNKFNL